VEAHRRIVAAIEGHHAERPHDQAEWLAHHTAEGELWDKASIYQGEPEERALARGSYAEPITAMQAALKSYDQSAAMPDATPRCARCAACRYRRNPRRSRPCCHTLREEMDTTLRLAWVWADQSAQQRLENTGKPSRSPGAVWRSPSRQAKSACARLRCSASG
jgi:hypothetical protein